MSTTVLQAERDKHKRLCCSHVCCGLLFFGFLSLAIPFVIMGCNTDVDGGCLLYDVADGTVYDYRISVDSCRDCYRAGYNGGTEICGEPYTCYQSFAQLNYGGPDDNCVFTTCKKCTTVTQAEADATRKYPLGSTHHLILRDGDEEVCHKPTAGRPIWYAGIVFCALTGIVMILWSIHVYCTYHMLDFAAMQGPWVIVPVGPSPSHATSNTYNNYNNHNTNFPSYAPVGGVGELEMVDTADMQRRRAAAPHTCGTDASSIALVSPAYAIPAYTSATYTPTYTAASAPSSTPAYTSAPSSAPAYTSAYTPAHTPGHTIAYPSNSAPQYTTVGPTAVNTAGVSYFEEYDMY